MVTITLSVGDCGYWEWEILNAIRQIPGEEYAVVQVSHEDDEVVVAGVNAASASEIAVQIYNMVGLRASVVSIVKEEGEGLRVTIGDEDDDDEVDDDDEEEDGKEEDGDGDDDEEEQEDGNGDGGDGGGDDDDDDDDDEEEEEEEEEQEDGDGGGDDEDDEAEDDDDTYIEMSSLSLYPAATAETSWESEQPVADPTPEFRKYFIF